MLARVHAWLARAHAWAAAVWLALACGAGGGFVARDLLGAGRPAVAGAWIAGAALGAASARLAANEQHGR